MRPARGQVPDLIAEIKMRADKQERVLVTTLTKRLAEDLTDLFCAKPGVRCKWLHSELDAFERMQVLRELREGAFDALVGVNLLREGLDLPEVSLVAILDADKEGFLRSETSLVQTIGRAARNVNAEVILYADKVTDSMQRAMDETERRRVLANGVQHRARHHARNRAARSSARASKRKSRPANWWPRSPARTIMSPRNIWRSCTAKCWRPPRTWSSKARRPVARQDRRA